MRLLVTGGAGFIGRALVARLVLDGHRVTVLDALTYAAHPTELRRIGGADFSLLERDVATPGAVASALRVSGAEAVLHLASESHVDRSLADAAPFLRSNAEGTWRVVEACRDARVRLVHVSTDEVYGDRDGQGAAREGDPTNPTNPYAASKACADSLVLSAVRAHGLDAVVTRGVNTYGPGQYPEKLLPLAARRWMAGQPMGLYGDGEQVRHWLYVDDHAAGIVAALHRGEPGAVLHFGGERRTNREVLGEWADALGVEGTTEGVPDRPGHDRVYLQEDAASRRALGWEPTVGLTDGLARTAAWTHVHPQFWATR